MMRASAVVSAWLSKTALAIRPLSSLVGKRNVRSDGRLTICQNELIQFHRKNR